MVAVIVRKLLTESGLAGQSHEALFQASPKSSARKLSLVAAIRRLALMPPFRFTGSMRIKFSVMSLSVAGLWAEQPVRAHLVVVENNIHAPMKTILHPDSWCG
jgi:hypothetical protein